MHGLGGGWGGVEGVGERRGMAAGATTTVKTHVRTVACMRMLLICELAARLRSRCLRSCTSCLARRVAPWTEEEVGFGGVGEGEQRRDGADELNSQTHRLVAALCAFLDLCLLHVKDIVGAPGWSGEGGARDRGGG